MASNTLSTFAFVLLIAAAMWFFHLNREGRTAMPTIEIEAQSVAQASPGGGSTPAAPVDTSETPAPLPPEAAILSGELEVLQRQLADAQDVLQTQQQSLAELQAQSQALASRQPASETNMTAARSQNQIQNILMEMDGYRNLESEINRQAEDSLRAQSSALQFQLQDLDNNIRVQENFVRQTNDELNYWRMNIGYVNQQQAETARLQDLLNTQVQQLELMHQQRLLLSAQALSDAQALQLQKQEALAGLAENRSAAQGEVESLRDSIIRLQQNQRRLSQGQVSLSSQLKQAQQNVSAQATQVQNLESQVQQKRQELESFLQ